MPHLGMPELLIILVVVVIIFGVGRLPEIGGAIGKSIRDFKRGLQGDDEGNEAPADKSEKAKG